VSREGKSEFLKPYYCKQHMRTSISVIYLKLLNYGKVLAAVLSIAESQWWVTHTPVTLVNCLQKYEFNINQASDREDVTEFSAGTDDWGQQKANISFQEQVYCDKDAVIG